MTLNNLIEKYPNKVKSSVTGFKPGDMIYSPEYEIITKYMIPIYSYKYDNRRGVWINKFVDKDLKIVQICAGREGDDAIMTFVIDKKWFFDFLKLNNSELLQRDRCFNTDSLIYIDNLDTDISDVTINAIGSYGTRYGASEFKIKEILKD